MALLRLMHFTAVAFAGLDFHALGHPFGDAPAIDHEFFPGNEVGEHDGGIDAVLALAAFAIDNHLFGALDCRDDRAQEFVFVVVIELKRARDMAGLIFLVVTGVMDKTIRF